VNRFLPALSPWSPNAITITEEPLTIVTHISVPERGGKPHLRLLRPTPPFRPPAMSAPECGGSEGYRELRDVRVEMNSGMVRGGGEGFAVCFWLYLSSSARPSSVILHQVGFLYLTRYRCFRRVWLPWIVFVSPERPLLVLTSVLL
jgi:hypothetical protein